MILFSSLFDFAWIVDDSRCGSVFMMFYLILGGDDYCYLDVQSVDGAITSVPRVRLEVALLADECVGVLFQFGVEILVQLKDVVFQQLHSLVSM